MAGKTIGVVGAGNISVRIMEYAQILGMNVLCWTKNPNHHTELKNTGIQFVDLVTLFETADVISVNLPNTNGTKGLISRELIGKMREMAIFISVSRLDTIDVNALFEKAKMYRDFYVCLDLDVSDTVVQNVPDVTNVLVTPHIAGGTIETRKRMFREVAEQVAQLI